jgi:energy-converting hydrogenase Eha subunit A
VNNSLNPDIKHQTSNFKRKILILRLISLWFALQVFLNFAAALYLTLHPPDEPVSWFERLDLTVNTGINAALAIGLWRRTTWVWATAVWLVPLYWIFYAWHMFIPDEGLMLWPFIMVDAVILGYLLGRNGRQVLDVPSDRWQRLSLLPAPMFALGLYALLAPIIGMFLAIAAAVSVVVVGWRRSISDLRSQRGNNC